MCTQEEPKISNIRVLTLQPVLSQLAAGWNEITPDLFAIKTVARRHVDTTFCPSREAMWLRTTLVLHEVLEVDLDVLQVQRHHPSSHLLHQTGCLPSSSCWTWEDQGTESLHDHGQLVELVVRSRLES